MLAHFDMPSSYIIEETGAESVVIKCQAVGEVQLMELADTTCGIKLKNHA
jgi:hypothetical protein